MYITFHSFTYNVSYVELSIIYELYLQNIWQEESPAFDEEFPDDEIVKEETIEEMEFFTKDEGANTHAKVSALMNIFM